MMMLVKRKFIDKDHIYACPACARESRNVCYLYYNEGREYRIFACPSCGLMFTRPVTIKKLDDRKMDSLEDAELFGNDLLKRLYQKFIIGRELYHVKRILGKGAFSLLDVGCGTGWITNIWRIQGFAATGIEPSEVRSSMAREKYGLTVLNDFIENIVVTAQYDVITLRHLVEHLEDPGKMLEKCRSLLKKDGIVVVVVPNINCIGRYIFGTRWTWVLPHHCNFFSPKSLSQLLHTTGYDIVNIYQTPSPLWYPESFLRLFPKNKWSEKVYSRLSLFTLLLFSPVVALGYAMRLSDNITIIGRQRGSER